jgi:hypothetical protein
MERLQGRGACSAGQANLVIDLGDGTYRGELLAVPGDQQDPLLLAGFDRQRERHPREDDDVVERN